MPASKGLAVAPVLRAFIETEALPGTGVEPARFWDAMERILRDLGTRATRRCWRKRDELQAKIDAWHRANPAKPVDLAAYTAFLARDRLPAARAGRLRRSAPPTWMPRSRSSPARSWSCRSPTRATR